MENNNTESTTETQTQSVDIASQPQFEQVVTQNPEPQKYKFKYKVDGQEREEEFDEATIKSRLSLASKAHQSMQTAAQERKQAQQFIEALKTNPLEVLNDERIMGSAKFRELAESYLAKQLEEQMLTPEEKQKRAIEQELKAYKEKEAQQLKAYEEQQFLQLQQQYQVDYEKKILQGLESTQLPKTARTIAKFAEVMKANLEHGLELEPAEIAKIVKDDYMHSIKELLGAVDGDALLALLGEETSNKIRKSDLQKLKQSNPLLQKQKVSAVKPQEKVETALTPEEYFERLRRSL